MTKAKEWANKHEKASEESSSLWKHRPQWRKNSVSVNQKGNLEIALPYEELTPKEALSLGKWIVNMYGKSKQSQTERFNTAIDKSVRTAEIITYGMVIGVAILTIVLLIMECKWIG